jgi:hypothetical protein
MAIDRSGPHSVHTTEEPNEPKFVGENEGLLVRTRSDMVKHSCSTFCLAGGKESGVLTLRPSHFLTAFRTPQKVNPSTA